MTQKQRARGGLFGPSASDVFAEQIYKLSDTVKQCSAHFVETSARDLKGIVDFEHKADQLVDDIHELLDNSFIMRFDIPDSMKLTDDLDNVIDQMRKVAIHLDIYAIHLKDLPAEALELMQIGDRMINKLHGLITMLGEPKLVLSKVRQLAGEIDDAESEADDLASKVERSLVEQFSKPSASPLGFIALHQLFHLLEEMTDDANHCARHIVSLARREA